MYLVRIHHPVEAFVSGTFGSTTRHVTFALRNQLEQYFNKYLHITYC
jgi:hypothetical protein